MNREFNEEKEIKKWVRRGVIILAVILLLTVLRPFGTIGAGERGVQLRFGAVTGKVFNEGLYFRIPIMEVIKKIDVKIQKEEVTASAASNDLQEVKTVVALNYHLDPKKVADIYQEVGMEYDNRIIAPAIQESVKAATAQFTAEELITKRPEVREKIEALLTEKIGYRGIIVDELNIVDLDFSTSFNKAIEKKVTAEQEALAAKNKLEQIKFEAQQKIAEAEGKAKAIEIEAKALRNNPQLLELRAIEKWDGKLPQIMTGDAIPFINLNR